jgi:hypothetical protein
VRRLGGAPLPSHPATFWFPSHPATFNYPSHPRRFCPAALAADWVPSQPEAGVGVAFDAGSPDRGERRFVGAAATRRLGGSPLAASVFRRSRGSRIGRSLMTFAAGGLRASAPPAARIRALPAPAGASAAAASRWRARPVFTPRSTPMFSARRGLCASPFFPPLIAAGRRAAAMNGSVPGLARAVIRPDPTRSAACAVARALRRRVLHGRQDADRLLPPGGDASRGHARLARRGV